MTAPSPVWKFFFKKEGKIICSLCGSEYKPPSDGSAGTLVTHLVNEHNISKEYQLTFSNTQRQITFSTGQPDRSVVIRQLLRWLVADIRPLSLPDSNYFRDFLALFLPAKQIDQFIPHSTNLTRTWLPKMVAAGKAAVLSALSSASSSFCYTTDSWTDKYNSRSYVTLSVTFIHDFKLITCCLATRHFKESHTQERLHQWLESVWKEYGLSPDVHGNFLAATCDNGANIVAAIRLTNHFYIPCIAHTLNLVMNELFQIEHVSSFLTRMKKIVKFFRKSNNASELLVSLVEKDAVKVRADCHQAYGPVKDEVHRKLPTRLKKMVSTRWNSAYDMLLRLWVLYPQILQVIHELAIKKVSMDDDVKQSAITDRDTIWDIQLAVRNLVMATKEVQAQNSPVLGPALLLLLLARRAADQQKGIGGLRGRISALSVQLLDERFFSPTSVFRSPQVVSKFVLSAPSFPNHSVSSPFDLAVLAAALDPRIRDLIIQELNSSELLVPLKQSLQKPALPHIAYMIRNVGAIEHARGADQADAVPDEMEEVELESAPTVRSVFWRGLKRQRAGGDDVPLDIQAGSYLAEPVPVEFSSIESDPLLYWKERATRWPLLSKIALRFLTSLAASAEAERNFSTAGDIVTATRAALKPKHVDHLLFLAKNIRSGVISDNTLVQAVAPEIK